MKPLILILCLAASAAQARLGETPNECVTRYGEPIKVDKEKSILAFKKAGVIILTSFRENACVAISFAKEETGALDIRVPFSDAEVEALLEANSGGDKWKPFGLSFDPQWANDTALAQLDKSNNILAIQTRAEYERAKAEKAANEKKKLEGF